MWMAAPKFTQCDQSNVVNAEKEGGEIMGYSLSFLSRCLGRPSPPRYDSEMAEAIQSSKKAISDDQGKASTDEAFLFLLGISGPSELWILLG
jgi:hypothetical protein